MPFLNSKDKRISQKASRKKKKKKSPTQDNRNQISLLPETTQPSQTKGTNKKQNMWSNGFQDSRHQTMKNSDSLREIDKVSPMIALVYYFEKISRPMAWGGGTQVNPSIFCKLRRCSGESGESRAARVLKRKVPRENAKDLPRFACPPPIPSIQQSISALKCQVTTKGRVKQNLKSNQEQCLIHAKGWEQYLLQPVRLEKHILKEHWVESSEGYSKDVPKFL